jgi:hypothetical protein
MDDNSIKNLGEEAELRFKDWLDNHNIPYMYIKQDTESFSSVFKNENYGKRPDFMVLLPNFGFIFVDVKNKKIDPTYRNYCLDGKETKKYSSLQRIFNLNIWYVISNEDYNYKTWFWIPISKVLESGIKKQTSSLSGDDFYPVPTEGFIQIAETDSIDRLFHRSF